MILFPPTPLGPRTTDRHGSGAFGAPRGSRTHRGLDWETAPWSLVVSPLEGIVTRIAKPYASPKAIINMGVEIKGTSAWLGYTLKMFYVSPRWELLGEDVSPRQPLGLALPMRHIYAGITPHVHLQLARGNRIIDPTPFLERT